MNVCRPPNKPQLLNWVVVIPNNFPEHHRAPQEGDFVEFESRRSDTINEDGIALIQAGGLFLGWVKRMDIPNIRPRLEAGEQLAAKVLYRESYRWEAAGGTCWRGILQLYTTVQ